MAERQSSQLKKGGKNLSTSAHRKERYAYYRTASYAKNKLKRIIRSCGVSFAQTWARTHQAEGVLQRLLKGRANG